MSKFLVFSDGHAQGINSKNRLGNYFADWLIKFDELLSIAKQNKCEAIIDAGDLFESDKPSYSIIDQIADRVEKNGIPIYSLFGNHAMSYGNIKNSENTGLAHLQKRSKFFKYLNLLEGKDWHIQGYDYYFDVENDLKKQGIRSIVNVGIKKSTWNVAIVHALVTPNKFFENSSYVQIKDIPTYETNLIICAHYHHPFIKKIKDTTFVNIGCFGRLAINEAKIEPSVLLLDTEKRSYEIIKLKSAKRGNEIFDLSKYEELKGQEKSIQEFLDSLKSVDLQSMDLSQQIVKIGNENKVEQKVIDYLLEKINDK